MSASLTRGKKDGNNISLKEMAHLGKTSARVVLAKKEFLSWKKEPESMIPRLFLSGLCYRLLKFSGKPHRLESISIEVTHRCICRCGMCNMWKIPSDAYL